MDARLTSLERIFAEIRAYLPQLLSFLSGFVIAILSEPARKKLWGPKLNISFSGNEDCITSTIEIGPTVGRKAYYIRAKVQNTRRSLAKNCKVYLVNVEKRSMSGEFIPTEYCDSIQLIWSCQSEKDKFRGIDLAKGVNQYVDILVTRENEPDFYPQLYIRPYRYDDLMTGQGIFRFAVQVVGDDANPEILKLVFEWTGVWNTFKVYRG